MPRNALDIAPHIWRISSDVPQPEVEIARQGKLSIGATREPCDRTECLMNHFVLQICHGRPVLCEIGPVTIPQGRARGRIFHGDRLSRRVQEESKSLCRVPRGDSCPHFDSKSLPRIPRVFDPGSRNVRRVNINSEFRVGPSLFGGAIQLEPPNEVRSAIVIVVWFWRGPWEPKLCDYAFNSNRKSTRAGSDNTYHCLKGRLFRIRFHYGQHDRAKFGNLSLNSWLWIRKEKIRTWWFDDNTGSSLVVNLYLNMLISHLKTITDWCVRTGDMAISLNRGSPWQVVLSISQRIERTEPAEIKRLILLHSTNRTIFVEW